MGKCKVLLVKYLHKKNVGHNLFFNIILHLKILDSKFEFNENIKMLFSEFTLRVLHNLKQFSITNLSNKYLWNSFDSVNLKT